VRFTLRQRQALYGYMFIFPWLIGFLVFVARPFTHSIQLAFSQVDMMAGFRLNYVGWQNFNEAFFIDERFVPILVTVIQRNLVDVPIILTFALFTAFLVNQRIRGVTLFRAVFFLPVVIASGLVVERLFNQDVGSLEAVVGLDIPSLVYMYLPLQFADVVVDVMARLTLILWRSGIQILLFVAGLQGISPSLYEASRIDGATDWEIFWKITLPMLSPIILVNTIYTIVDGFTDIFNPMVNFLRTVAFSGSFRLGYAAALGWIYFLFVFILIGLVFITSKKWVFYGGEREG